MEQTKKIEIIESVERPGDEYVEVTPEIVEQIHDILAGMENCKIEIALAAERLKNENK